MFKLLNRFAWIISLGLALSLSLISSRSGPFDDEGFWIFVISLVILKFVILSKRFIESRLEFFVQQLGLLKNGVQTKAASVKKEQKIENTREIVNDDIEENNIVPDIKMDNVVIKKETKKVEEKKEPSKIAIFIKEFFSENLLAKIGAILVFLGVLFLMSLIWGQIPSVLKIILGFAIGFGVYFAGVILDKKGYEGESRILLGAGILINFLVILAGKYLIEDNHGAGVILTTGVTFLFLILNTVFGIVTSFVYNSRTLLLFSFIFAYLNPFLIGGSSDTPYVLLGYSMIVSLGALFVGAKKDDNILKYSSFVLGNLLFLAAPFTMEMGWIMKLVSSGTLGLLTILSLYNTNPKDKIISHIFILNYVFIIFQLMIGGNSSILGVGISYISYMISILLFFGIGIYLLMVDSIKSVLSLFLFPILIIVGLIFSGVVNLVAPTLGIVVLVYLIGFGFVNSILNNTLKYLFFVILGFFIFFVNGFISFDLLNNGTVIDFGSFLTTVIVSFVFMFTSYIFSRKNGLQYLYTIGTIGTILTILPVLVYEPILNNNIQMIVSIIAVVIFALSNQILPFINKNLVEKVSNTKNLVISSVIGVLFIGGELFIYGDRYFPGITLGLAFGALAIVYFVLGFLMMNKLGINEVKKELAPKNTIYSYLFISISIFSLAIALVFSTHPEVISTVWLFEASILFYFYNKTKESKIFAVGLILFIIGIFNLFILLDVVRSKEFIFLIPFTLIGLSFVYNLKNLNFAPSGIKRVFHDIFHIIGIGILAGLLFIIIPNTGHGWSLLGISIFLFVIGNIYAYFNSKILKVFFIICIGTFALLHIEGFDNIIRRIDGRDLGYLRILQYASTAIIGGAIIGWNKFNKTNVLNNFIKGLYAIYILVIVSFYVEDIFNTTFAITIFWGIVSSIMLFFGISVDKIKYRTMGLYLLSGVLIKIFASDLWIGIDDAVTRVLALIGIGILLIVISTRYTKKYGNNLKGEFNLDNLSSSK